jgi:hypothetical protein
MRFEVCGAARKNSLTKLEDLEPRPCLLSKKGLDTRDADDVHHILEVHL